ncbi:MAG: hypothetical protein IPP82_09355 [Xanthomonadales bacterium]|nr:hypothetical protein [Xanthomonadales bacterium]
MNMFRYARFLLLLMLGATMTTGQASAQICALPGILTPNTSFAMDTCTGEQFLPVACGLFVLSGPAAIFHLPLAYPIGTISVQSLNVQYDPAVFLLQSHCNSNVQCGMAVDSGQAMDVLNLAEVDSGDYFLAIAPMETSNSIPCAPVIITYSVTAAEQAIALDGVFRAGLSAPPTVP